MNKTAALEWLKISYHDLKSAQILFEANHYTDSIGNDLQQSLEKMLKSIIASKNNKIPKTHDLYELYAQIEELKLEEEEVTFLDMATEYFKEDRYPNPHYCLPQRVEVESVLRFTEDLLKTICNVLKISTSTLKENTK